MKKDNLQAIRKSIKHWMLDIRRPFLKGDRIIKGNFPDYNDMQWVLSKLAVKRYDVDCALCRLVDDYCPCCSLWKTTGGGCKKHKSAFRAFLNNPNLQITTDIVRDLVCTYWAERNGEND